MLGPIEERDIMKVDQLMLELKREMRSIDYLKSIAMGSYCRILKYLGNIGETMINIALD